MAVTRSKSGTTSAPSKTLDGNSTSGEDYTKYKKILQECHPESPNLGDIKEPHNCDKVRPDHTYVSYSQVHWGRKKQLMEKYPEIMKLCGPDLRSAIYTAMIVALQLTCAYYVGKYDLSWLSICVLMYTVGAIADHAMWVLIHDATHDLVFKKPVHNTAFHLFMNVPLVFPSTVSFRLYHRQHHSHLNEAYADPDLPGPWEQVLGKAAWSKALWVFLFPFFMSVRMIRYQQEFDWWIVINWVTQMTVNWLVFDFFGFKALAYLFLASVFALGFHPMGARWIAEHYATHPDQETYSYYGFANRLAFNIGYHNEHHDMPMVAWSRLPAVKAAAPEFYNNLHTHNSYTGIIWRFITDPDFTLASRVVRPAKGGKFENLQFNG
jgi:sphingolipid delta-4 desaturase